MYLFLLPCGWKDSSRPDSRHSSNRFRNIEGHLAWLWPSKWKISSALEIIEDRRNLFGIRRSQNGEKFSHQDRGSRGEYDQFCRYRTMRIFSPVHALHILWVGAALKIRYILTGNSYNKAFFGSLQIITYICNLNYLIPSLNLKKQCMYRIIKYEIYSPDLYQIISRIFVKKRYG